MRDYYRYLGVPADATPRQIRDAYRRLARRFHPDGGHGDAVRFSEVQQAYDHLSTKKERQKYDRERAQSFSALTGPGWESELGSEIEDADNEFGPLDITEEPLAIHDIVSAIGDGRIPDAYVRSGALVVIRMVQRQGDDDMTAQVIDVAPKTLRALLSTHIPCVKFTTKDVHRALPGATTSLAILTRTDWPGVPVLQGVVSVPVLRKDGSLVQEPGYDRRSGLFLDTTLKMRPVPEAPTPHDIAEAKGLLLGLLLADFPWAGDADRANYLAALVTPILRRYAFTLSPFLVITAPERGSGKTLLAEILRLIYEASMRPYASAAGEMRRAVTAALRDVKPVICFDNIGSGQTVDSPQLAQILTQEQWSDQLLGLSRDVTLVNDRLWACTGTNVRLGGDLPGRSVLVSLDYGGPNPDQRTDFAVKRHKGKDLDEWVREERGEVYHALLTLVRAWIAAGAPRSGHVMRGYTRWAQACGGFLAFHETPGFLGNRASVQAHDSEAEIMIPFLTAWRALFGDQWIRAETLLGTPSLTAVIPRKKNGDLHATAISLGKALGEISGRWYGEPDDQMTIRHTYDTHDKVKSWRVETAIARTTRTTRRAIEA
jgi:hypothetical protein